MSRRATIDLRVVPLATVSHAGQLGSFMVLSQPFPFTQVGYAETLAGSIFVEDIDSFIGVYERLSSVSLDQKATRTLIETIERDLE
jgi:hypothetical protein